MLRFLTAGESHGKALIVTIDGIPAGLQLQIPNKGHYSEGGFECIQKWHRK